MLEVWVRSEQAPGPRSVMDGCASPRPGLISAIWIILGIYFISAFSVQPSRDPGLWTAGFIPTAFRL